MPHYTAQITGSGWFTFTADDDKDADATAAELVKFGPPLDAEWDHCDLDAVERDEP